MTEMMFSIYLNISGHQDLAITEFGLSLNYLINLKRERERERERKRETDSLNFVLQYFHL